MRKKFLEHNWKAFPSMPEGQFVTGRIAGIVDGNIFLSRERAITVTPQLALHPVTIPVFGSEILSVLTVGDVIAARENEIWLLAPQQQEFALKLRSPSRELLREYSEFLSKIRQFFSGQGFLEVHTPGLVVCPGTEPYLDVFSSEFRQGQKSLPLYLPTSPELHLKKMLALDHGPIFELKNCFRNGEISPHHEPEFLMLEWYRPFSNLQAIAEDVQALFRFVSGNKTLELQKTSLSQLFLKHLDFVLTPRTSYAELWQLANSKNIPLSEISSRQEESIDDLFNLIFIEKIEPLLPPQTPILMTGYPPYLAAYSRLTEDGWADRFEIYWQGLELANAFHEINDPRLQEERMSLDLLKKQKTGRAVFPLDREFLQALHSGVSPTGGIALGLERLFMVISGLSQIQELKTFPYQRLLE